MIMRMFALGVLFVLGAGDARGDGMAFTVTGGTVDVQATAQRAIMWHRDGVWEIHIQPMFDRDPGKTAWVVPFPVLPEVSEGSADFFDELELATSPVFLKVCAEGGGSSFCFGCPMGSKAGGDSGDVTGGDVLVRRWGAGQVGSLDYVIVSAADGESLVAWLDAMEFEVSPEAAGLLHDFETEGVYFFVAQVSEVADPALPISPVRFSLPDMQTPSYPLRLTALGVPEGSSLDLTVWIIFDGEDSYWPRHHAVKTLETYPATAEEYDAAVDDFFYHYPGMTLLARFARDLPYEYSRLQACSWHSCVPYESLGVDEPEEYSDEFMEVASQHLQVVRLQARLQPGFFTRDLELELVDRSVIPFVENVFEELTCEGQLASTGILGLLVAGLWLARRRRSG